MYYLLRNRLLFDPDSETPGAAVADPPKGGETDTGAALGDFMGGSSDEDLDAVLDRLEPEEDEKNVSGELAGETPEDKPDAKDDEPESDELALARSALARDGFPKSAIDKLDKEEIIAMGNRATARQTQIDEILANAKADSDKPGEGDGDTAKSLTEVVQTELAPVIDDLGLGDDAAKALGSAIEKAVLSSVGNAQELSKQAQAMDARIESLFIANARASLSQEFPQLAKIDRFGEVVVVMKELAESKSFGERLRADATVQERFKIVGQSAYVEALMERASSQVFAEEIAEQRDKAKRGERKAKAEAQPVKPQNVKTPKDLSKLTADERDTLILDAIEDGDQETVSRLSYREA